MGTKLQKTVNYQGYKVITDYRDGYQYETKPVAQGGRGYAELLFFSTAEGYVKALYHPNLTATSPKKYQYIYIYKDHLGNNRLSYTLDPKTNQIKILEENHYYPFGLKHGNYNQTRKDVKYQELALSKKEVKQVMPEAVKFKYLYNGKELQDELGLNWYDYGARNYQADLGRWFNTDPLAEKYQGFSHYNYTLGNPIRLVDVDGRESEDWVKNLKTGEYEWDNNVTSIETTPEGFKYIGKRDEDIVNDLFGKSLFYTSDSDLGFTTFASSDRGAAAHHFYARTKMQINLRANTSISNKNGIVSKKFNGIDIFVDIIPYRVAPTLTEKNPDLSSVKLQGIKMYMNNSAMYSVIPKRATFFSTGEISALHMESFIPAKVISSNFPSSHFLEFSFKGLYYQGKISLSRYPFVTVNNYTYLNKTITYTND